MGNRKIYIHRGTIRTTGTCFTLYSLIYRIQTKQKLYCAFVDFTTAFDSINRNILFSRLIKCGISSKMIHIIIALYTNVMSCVKLNKSNTDIFSCKDGLRQGDSLSPILFSFYINDLPSKQSRVNTSTDIDILLYAYDLVILASSRE